MLDPSQPLTHNMTGIGMNFASEANLSAPIEETLVHASSAGMDDHYLRVLAIMPIFRS